MTTHFNLKKKITTNLTVEEVLSRFEKNIEKQKWYKVGVPKSNLEKIRQAGQTIDLQVQTFYRRSNMPVFSCKISPISSGSEIQITPKNIGIYYFLILVIWSIFLVDAVFFQNYRTTFDAIGTITLAILAPIVGVGSVYFLHYWYIDTAEANIKNILNKKC